MFDKTDVNGPNANEVFKYLRLNSELEGAEVSWNFGKFLVDRQGHAQHYFEPTIQPFAMRPQIESMLGLSK